MATLLAHIAHNTMVIVDPRYVENAIAKADSTGKIPAETIVNVIININVHDWTKTVNNNHIQKKNHGLIFAYSEKLTISVTNANQSFISENAKNISQKLNKNLLIASTFHQRDKKFIQIAHKNINGKAIIETFKLKPTIQRIEEESIVPTLDQRITAKADVKDKIPVQTKASTNTETTFELSKILVIKIQLQKDFRTDDVNLLNKFLNHQFVIEETACSK